MEVLIKRVIVDCCNDINYLHVPRSSFSKMSVRAIVLDQGFLFDPRAG